jgi:molybdopterin-guanine dinucleotide biosynthesis protein A
MGTDKALLDIAGQPMVLVVAEAIARVCGPVSLVGDPTRYGGLGLPVVADDFPGCGPLAGMEAALRATGAEWNLVVACDMPALNAAMLQGLFVLAEGGDCAVPEYADGRMEPLCAVYHKRCHGAILSALERGTRKVTQALREAVPALALRYLRVEGTAAFANLNTPADVAAWLKTIPTTSNSGTFIRRSTGPF